MRVLIAEDERLLAEALRAGIAMHGIAVDTVNDGASALEAASITMYDVIILDRDLPIIHGDDVCRSLMSRESRPAILMLTAARAVQSRVEGLALGADDYLPKPFEFPELVARIRALARRPRKALPAVLASGDLRLDPVRHEATRAGRPLELARKEFAVLEVLMRDPGSVISAEVLLEQVWDENINPFTHTVKVTISALRRKLGDPPPIMTVTGVGYTLRDPR